MWWPYPCSEVPSACVSDPRPFGLPFLGSSDVGQVMSCHAELELARVLVALRRVLTEASEYAALKVTDVFAASDKVHWGNKKQSINWTQITRHSCLTNKEAMSSP